MPRSIGYTDFPAVHGLPNSTGVLPLWRWLQTTHTYVRMLPVCPEVRVTRCVAICKSEECTVSASSRPLEASRSGHEKLKDRAVVAIRTDSRYKSKLFLLSLLI